MAIRRRLQTEELPIRCLPGIAGSWNLAEGEHPKLGTLSALADALTSLPEGGKPLETQVLGLPWKAPTHGHHVVQDAGYLAAAGEEIDEWPVAPMFVRDIAGRVVQTGLVPCPDIPEFPFFPQGCSVLRMEAEGADLLEKVFLTSFRRLELAAGPGVALSGQPTVCVRALYGEVHRYPYKLRVDSFYQDGFRLPQTQRLFVRDADKTKAQSLGEELVSRWKKRPEGQAYEVFYEENNGVEWFSDLFEQGCTVIPTFEAFNGFFKVTADFGMEDVWPGRAVKGLHVIVEEKEDPSPRGTILQVVEPGFATRAGVRPAKVVVSNGAGYVSPHGGDPRPMLPNLSLPHPRVTGVWGKVWIPTHPRHFESPLLWDWSSEGSFQQVSGPLWDPVHYYYTSTPRILRAFRKPWEENPALAPVPEDMLPRFHPVSAMNSYDTVNTVTGQFRSQQLPRGPLSSSSLDSVPLPRESAGVGYHPLPVALEYEMDPCGLPWQMPQKHMQGACPAGQRDRLVSIISPTVTVEEAQKTMVVTPEPDRQTLLQPIFFEKNQEDVFVDLHRYVNASAAENEKKRLWVSYLPHVPAADLAINVKRFFANRQYRQTLATLGADVPAKFYAFREEALAWRRLRHRMLRKYPAMLLEAWWRGESLEWAEKQDQATYEGQHVGVSRALAQQRGAAKSVPALLASAPKDALPEGASSAKIKKKIPVTKSK